MRVLFPKGEQNKFINRILKEISVAKFAEICNISKRTVRDWRREKFLADFDSLKKVSKRVNFKIPKNVKIRNPFWYTYKGAKIGGKLGAEACFKKYGYYGGDPEYRKKKWYEWWERDGKYNHPLTNCSKPFLKPKYSEELAELIGIVLGDGSVTRGQIIITLNSKDDKEFSEYVVNLLKKLFDVHVGIHYRKDSMALSCVVSRVGIVKYCVEKLGLRVGNKVKQQVDIPDWIKKNNAYAIACVRGLIDTDGSVFSHKYRAGGKQYSYKKVSFTNYSKPIRLSMFDILKHNGIKSRLYKDRDVRIDSVKDMKKYFDIFGSSNPKHLKKYYK